MNYIGGINDGTLSYVLQIKTLGSENVEAGCIKCIDLLMIFFSKILEQAPVLMLWDHLSVRKEFIQLLKELNLCLMALTKCHAKDERNTSLLALSFMRFASLLSMLQRQLIRYAITLDDQVKNSFESCELEKYKDMIEDMRPTFSVDAACFFLHTVLSKLEMSIASLSTCDKLDVDSDDDARMTWLWMQVEKSIGNAHFASITKGISIQKIVGKYLS